MTKIGIEVVELGVSSKGMSTAFLHMMGISLTCFGWL